MFLCSTYLPYLIEVLLDIYQEYAQQIHSYQWWNGLKVIGLHCAHNVIYTEVPKLIFTFDPATQKQ